ncbi:hypothetical protein D9615_001317 [Tricholomella constricta]|uniref:Uncharacterized protein n=1 Tax=Tricholomella constricta TaxID=117010 RepID=A0A8H5HL97_9AGAR|nr:hypothetical protein D9615_001317 [Tricholomella constricta]
MAFSIIPTSYSYPQTTSSRSTRHTRRSRDHALKADRRRGEWEYYDKNAQYDWSPEYLSVWDDRYSTEDRLRQEANIRAEVDRALLAQKRARAKKAAQIAAVLAYGCQSQHLAENIPEDYQRLLPQRRAHQEGSDASSATSPERPHTLDPIHTFRYPRDNHTRDEEIHVIPHSPASSSKRLAPLSRFNPFARTRAESLSSIIADSNNLASSDEDIPNDEPAESWSKKLRRAATVADLFMRFNRESKKEPLWV